MAKYISSSENWQLVSLDQGAKFPTFGYETTSVGSPLVLEVDTTTTNPKVGRSVVITYTKAKNGYGVAKISCSNGCSCEPETVASSVPYDQTVLFLEEVHPTPAPACHVSVELDPSSPGGSKVRISGVAVTADPGDISGRIGEEKYMSWLTGDNWAA